MFKEHSFRILVRQVQHLLSNHVGEQEETELNYTTKFPKITICLNSMHSLKKLQVKINIIL